MIRSPLEANGGDVKSITRLLRLGEPSVGNAESTQPHPIRLLAEVRNLPRKKKERGTASTQ